MARLLSPSRLNDFLGCEHRTYLDLLAERGEIPREEYLQPDAELMLERGRRHEEAFLTKLNGLDVVSLADDRAARATGGGDGGGDARGPRGHPPGVLPR